MVEIDLPRKAKLKKKYPAIVKSLRKRIQQSEFSEMLPGVQLLEKEYDVNFMTVNKAINKLVEEGLLYRIPRKGTFVKAKPQIIFLSLINLENMVNGMPELYINLIHSIEATLQQKQHSLRFQQHNELKGFKQVNSRQETEPNNGIIFIEDASHPKTITTLSSLPCVKTMGMIDENATWDHVTYDNEAIGKLVAEYFISKDHEVSAFITDSSEGVLYINRAESFKNTLSSSGKTCKLFIPSANGTHIERLKQIQNMLAQLISSKPRPTALFLPASWMLPTVYNYLYSHNLTPGKDIEIVSCDKDESYLSFLDPRPVSVSLQIEKIGRKAVEVLLKRMADPELPRQIEILNPILDK